MARIGDFASEAEPIGPDTPGAQPGDALWSCAGWLAGAPSLGAHPLGAFAALDALLGELVPADLVAA